MNEDILILVERETLGLVNVALERPFMLLELEERLSRVAGTTGWGRSKTQRLKLWKKRVSDRQLW